MQMARNARPGQTAQVEPNVEPIGLEYLRKQLSEACQEPHPLQVLLVGKFVEGCDMPP